MSLFRRKRTQALPPPAYAGFLNVLLVLMAFMAVFVALQRTGSLPTDLEDWWMPDKGIRQVTILVTSDHRFYWDREGPLPIAQLAPRMDAESKLHSKVIVQLASDAKARMGDAVEVMDILHRNPAVVLRASTPVWSGP